MLGTINESSSLVTALTTYGPLLAAGAILVSTAVAIGIAYFTVRSQREMARKRATLDMIIKTESDEHYRTIREAYLRARDNIGLVPLVETEDPEGKELRHLVQLFLNHYELIAIAIRHRILDEDLYKAWRHSTVKQHWEECREMVQKIQDQKQRTAYNEFKALAERWITASSAAGSRGKLRS